MLSCRERPWLGPAATVALGSLLVTAVGAGIAWWRWERIRFVAGDVPMPPRAERVRTPRPVADAEPGADPCIVVSRIAWSDDELRRFYGETLESRGWVPFDVRGDELHFGAGAARPEERRDLRITLRYRPEQERTTFTLRVDPCLPPSPSR